MNVVLMTVLLLACYHWRLPLWVPLAALWGWWLLWLPVNTWRDFLAAMTYQRLKHGGSVVLPPEDERCNEPDGVFIVERLMGPAGMLKNFVLAQLVAVFIFRTAPEWPNDVGLTKLLTRLAKEDEGWRGDLAARLLKRWLHRYDRRGRHT